ncbi:MAG: hypothetical protein AB7F98_00945 [Novosphingobium sp.]
MAAMLGIGPTVLHADVAPYQGKRPPRPDCGKIARVDSVTLTRFPRAAVAARGMGNTARSNHSLQYRGVSSPGTARATVHFDWVACGRPGARGNPVAIRYATDIPNNPQPGTVRFVSVHSQSNVVTVRF